MSDIKKAVKYLQNYIGTYDNQRGYENYQTTTLIDDVLYGLGVAIDEKYKFANGYADFQEFLKEHLEASTK